MQWNTDTQTSDHNPLQNPHKLFFCMKANYLKKKRKRNKIQLNLKFISSDCKERLSPWTEAIWSHLSKLDVSLMWIRLCIGILSFDYWNLYDGDFSFIPSLLLSEYTNKSKTCKDSFLPACVFVSLSALRSISILWADWNGCLFPVWSVTLKYYKSQQGYTSHTTTTSQCKHVHADMLALKRPSVYISSLWTRCRTQTGQVGQEQPTLELSWK